MSETKKLTPEELDLVRSLRRDYSNLTISLGELELQLNNINQEKQQLLESHKQLLEKEKQTAQQLQEKYGQGTIDLETGEIKA